MTKIDCPATILITSIYYGLLCFFTASASRRLRTNKIEILYLSFIFKAPALKTNPHSTETPIKLSHCFGLYWPIFYQLLGIGISISCSCLATVNYVSFEPFILTIHLQLLDWFGFKFYSLCGDASCLGIRLDPLVK